MAAFAPPARLPHAASPALSGALSSRRPFRAPARRAARARAAPRAQQSTDLAVMVNGVPGRMAAATASEVLARGLCLAAEALTGGRAGARTFHPARGAAAVQLAPPDEHAACLRRMRERYARLVVVDYTQPAAANANVERYAEAGVSFVIGTTGGDVAAMRRVVRGAPGVYAVIAPNMGKQIVAFQAMMEMMGREFPGAFRGYRMTVRESHQANKVDTSGTAKAVVGAFNELGLEFRVDEIEKVRTKERSVEEMGVPEEFVAAGHAFHTYHLTSPDGSVNFEFQHNVCGRQVYAAGTVDAVQFLQAQREKSGDVRIFNMIDILRSGGMS